MNAVTLMGGLGNQLFQYAFGQLLQEYQKLPVRYNVEWYERNRLRAADRPYQLDKFHVQVPTIPRSHGRLLREGSADLETMLELDGVTYHGYWQYPEWYNVRLMERLRMEFHLRPEYHTKIFLEWRDAITRHNSVALHVRRGDYLNHERHLVLPVQYYRNAMMYIFGMKKDPEIYVFSDDLAWCKAHLDDCHFVDLPDYQCFELMRHCKHFIISNSTFSWWPANLAYNATIIAPLQWRRDRDDGAVMYEKRMLLNDWMKMSLS